MCILSELTVVNSRKAPYNRDSQSVVLPAAAPAASENLSEMQILTPTSEQLN